MKRRQHIEPDLEHVAEKQSLREAIEQFILAAQRHREAVKGIGVR